MKKKGQKIYLIITIVVGIISLIVGSVVIWIKKDHIATYEELPDLPTKITNVLVSSSDLEQKQKRQEKWQKKIESYLKKQEECFNSTEPLIRDKGFKISKKIEKIGMKNKKVVVPLLIQVIRDTKYSFTLRLSIGLVIGRLGLVESVPLLIEALRDEDEITKQAAMTALCHISNDEAIDALVMALKDDKLRGRAIYTVGLVSGEVDKKVWKKWKENEKLKEALKKISLSDVKSITDVKLGSEREWVNQTANQLLEMIEKGGKRE